MSEDPIKPPPITTPYPPKRVIREDAPRIHGGWWFLMVLAIMLCLPEVIKAFGCP